MLVFMMMFAAGCSSAGNSDNSSEQTTAEALTIHDVYAWTDYPESEFFPVFSDSSKEEKLSFTYDKEKLQIDETKHTVKGLVAGIHRVKAVSENYTAQFAVKVRTVDKELSYFKPEAHWLTYVGQMKKIWKEKGRDGHTTVFIGDSFFDEAAFWTNFYEEYYPGKDALCFGIGSTTSFTWETLTDTFLAEMSPKNIVMHIGTNNIYDKYGEADDTIENIQRMFVLMHDRLPDTKIYYFAITQRGYEDFRNQYAIVETVNEAMKGWCEERRWITFLDTCADLPVNMLKTDKIHPLLSSYQVFTDALNSSDIAIEPLA